MLAVHHEGAYKDASLTATKSSESFEKETGRDGAWRGRDSAPLLRKGSFVEREKFSVPKQKVLDKEKRLN